jgi:hypothetical protein
VHLTSTFPCAKGQRHSILWPHCNRLHPNHIVRRRVGLKSLQYHRQDHLGFQQTESFADARPRTCTERHRMKRVDARLEKTVWVELHRLRPQLWIMSERFYIAHHVCPCNRGTQHTHSIIYNVYWKIMRRFKLLILSKRRLLVFRVFRWGGECHRQTVNSRLSGQALARQTRWESPPCNSDWLCRRPAKPGNDRMASHRLAAHCVHVGTSR